MVKPKEAELLLAAGVKLRFRDDNIYTHWVHWVTGQRSEVIYSAPHQVRLEELKEQQQQWGRHHSSCAC